MSTILKLRELNNQNVFAPSEVFPHAISQHSGSARRMGTFPVNHTDATHTRMPALIHELAQSPERLFDGASMQIQCALDRAVSRTLRQPASAFTVATPRSR